MNDKELELLRKIKSLADKGIGGEKETAEQKEIRQRATLMSMSLDRHHYNMQLELKKENKWWLK